MKGSLFRKYAAVMMLLVGGALAVGGVFELIFNYLESRAQTDQKQSVEARAAAARIEQYLKGVEQQVFDISSLPWATAALNLQDRRDEYRRLLKLAPAIAEIRSVDAEGKERIKVSRVDVDELDSGRRWDGNSTFLKARLNGVDYSATYFKDGSEPYLTLGILEEGKIEGQQSGGKAWVTLIELNLKFVGDVVRQIKVGRNGRAFVIDGENHLVAHPNISYVLRRTDVSPLPQVAALRAEVRSGKPALPNSVTGESLDGMPVLTTYAPIGVAGWWLFVEQPMSEAFGPIYDSMIRTVILFVLGALLALAASYFLARRLSLSPFLLCSAARCASAPGICLPVSKLRRAMRSSFWRTNLTAWQRNFRSTPRGWSARSQKKPHSWSSPTTTNRSFSPICRTSCARRSTR